MGITEELQEDLGAVLNVDLPEIGADVEAGDVVAVVESAFGTAAVHAPVPGRIAMRNDELVTNPIQINVLPLQTWLFKLLPTR